MTLNHPLVALWSLCTHIQHTDITSRYLCGSCFYQLCIMILSRNFYFLWCRCVLMRIICEFNIYLMTLFTQMGEYSWQKNSKGLSLKRINGYLMFLDVYQSYSIISSTRPHLLNHFKLFPIRFLTHDSNVDRFY